MPSLWILCGNGARATIYSAGTGSTPLVEIASLHRPAVRAKEMDLVTDRPGRTFDSFGAGRHAMAYGVGPKETEEIRFAREVVDRLEQGRVAQDFDRLVVVAAPAFLGHLRGSMSAPLAAAVRIEIDKDLTALRPDELRSRLPEQL